MPIPNPDWIHPLADYDGVVFLKNVVRSPMIQVGEYTYFDDPQGAEEFEWRNVLYHFQHSGDRLVIGKFCAIAREVRFIMNGANHSMAGYSTYPFSIFGLDWAAHSPPDELESSRGDTIIGNDVWIGYGATILPGVRIGDGAIIGARAVVARNVEPYSIVVGNPAREVRKRFDDDTIRRLLALAWWDWPIEKITRHLALIVHANPALFDVE